MSTYNKELTDPMGVPRASMNKFDLFIDGNVNDVAFGDPTPTNTRPTTRAIDIQAHSAVRLMFGGTTNADEFVNYQVIGWKWLESGNGTAAVADAWMPEVLASGVATLGTDVYAATNIGAGTELIADTITDTIFMPGTSIYSPADNTRAIIEVPTHGAMVITIDVDRGDNDTTDVFLQLGEIGGLGGGAGSGGSFATPATRVPQPISKTVAAPDTDVPLGDAGTFVRWFGIMAKKVGGDNANEIYLYDSTVDNDNIQGIQLDPGDYWETPVLPGVQYDLNDFVIDATTAADAVQGFYILG